MDSAVLLLRVLLALACVLGLLWVVARRSGGRRTAVARRNRTPALVVVARQALGNRSAVALVEVAGRRLVVGVGEHGVTLLTEVGPDPEPPDAGRTVLDPTELERLVAVGGTPDATTPDLPDRLGRSAATPTLSPTAARTSAVPTPRNPLEGSILDAATWRRAVEAVQERTVRR